ncbi:MAG: hypothetical protein ACLFUJ_10155 [Phycisphaerae bacterium]
MSPSTLQVASAMCRSCCIEADRFDDAVQDTLIEMVRAPRKYRAAAGARAVRRHLARQLHVPARSLGADLGALKLIGLFEFERSRAAAAGPMAAGDEGLGQFDYHSRRFAEENQVCPRCGRAGTFHTPGDRCRCGWRL